MTSMGERKIRIAGTEHEAAIAERKGDRFLRLEYDDIPFEIFLEETKSGNRLALIDGLPHKIGEATRGQGNYSVLVNEKKIQISYSVIGRQTIRDVARPPTQVSKLRSSGREHGRVVAHMPGRIVSVKVKLGSSVKTGDPIMVLLAMKMENTLVAPLTGIVKEVHVEPGDNVNKGDLLAVIA
jgi:glutaconyl-CoA/methylmalonyl-CoA decarboxylase subunit gamma